MKAVIQRVKNASVEINSSQISIINEGFLIFLGIVKDDTEKDLDFLVDKIVNLRIMADQAGKMNRSIIETKGEIMVVSQFTLAANLKGGRRPDFFTAMEPEKAKKLYELFIEKLKEKNIQTYSGIFGADMDVELTNDGPVTFVLDSKNL